MAENRKKTINNEKNSGETHNCFSIFSVNDFNKVVAEICALDTGIKDFLKNNKKQKYKCKKHIFTGSKLASSHQVLTHKKKKKV